MVYHWGGWGIVEAFGVDGEMTKGWSWRLQGFVKMECDYSDY